jgi:acyl carrier protein
MPTSPRVYSVFAETLGIPPAGVSDATAPENTPEWDSVKAMDLVVALEEAFDVRFSTKEIISMRTVGIVRKVLTAKGFADA